MKINHRKKIQNLLEREGFVIKHYYVLDKRHNLFVLTNNKFFPYYSDWALRVFHLTKLDPPLTKKELIERINLCKGFDSSWQDHLELIEKLNILHKNNLSKILNLRMDLIIHGLIF